MDEGVCSKRSCYHEYKFTEVLYWETLNTEYCACILEYIGFLKVVVREKEVFVWVKEERVKEELCDIFYWMYHG